MELQQKDRDMYGPGGMNEDLYSDKQSHRSKDFSHQIAIKKDASENEESLFDPYTAKIKNN